MTTSLTFALVAGETSGDQLGAALIAELQELYPGARFVGIGGAGMRDSGMECWWRSDELSVFGLFEVLSHFPRLLRIRRELKRRLLALRPDAFIGIDAPDFNLGLEKQLKSAGLRTVHYVSPTVWAWRPGRVRKIARAADLVLCLFPFESDFYRGHGVMARYVGHPMAGQIPFDSDPLAARRQLGLNEEQRVIALLPGSRRSEVSRLLNHLLEAAALLGDEYPGVQFAAAIANPEVGELIRRMIAAQPGPEISLFEGRARMVMAAADVVVCASGTATLETMLINRPLVSVYRLAPASYQLAKHLRIIRQQFFALPNILAKQDLVPELIQHEATAERIAQHASRWLRDDSARQNLKQRFDQLHRELLSDPLHSAGKAVAGLLENPGAE